MRFNTGAQTTEKLVRTADECQWRFDNSDLTPELESAIDTKVLQSWRDALGEDSSEFLANVIDIYLEDAAKQLSAIATAVACADAKLLYYEAHVLKSSSATLGAVTLSSLCRTLESMGSSGITTQAPQLVSQICTEYGRVRAALQKQRQKFKAKCGQRRANSFWLD